MGKELNISKLNTISKVFGKITFTLEEIKMKTK